MIHKMANCITVYFCSRGIIEKDSIEVYQYGFELLVSMIIEIISTMILSLAVHDVGTGILYLILMMVIRTNTGGYHADTPFRCNFTFASVYVCSILIWKILIYEEKCNFVLWILLILSFLYVVCNAPIQNHNKQLNKEQKERSNNLIYDMHVQFINDGYKRQSGIGKRLFFEPL